jgi:mediator of replication checkpoint protein 1
MSSPFRGNPAVAAKKAKLKPQKSEFVVEEADESDEETGFGFGQKEKDDEDGEHLDAELTALMDHQEMDDKTLNEVKVAEKARYVFVFSD